MGPRNEPGVRGRPDWLEDWFERVKVATDMRVSACDLDSSTQWSLSDREIRHRSGRFFTVTGIEWTSPEGERVSGPLLKQTDVGTLGFLLEPADTGNVLLAYAKVEPGNVNTVQLAPTCQATESNLDRVHGGESPPFADFFTRRRNGFVYDVPQSEQGSRFLFKRNRNILAVGAGSSECPDTHRRLAVEHVLELSDVDFALNSDARSVLICSPWEVLTGRAPFSRYPGGFGADLAASAASGGGGRLAQVEEEIEALRRDVSKPVTVGLDELDGWRITNSGLQPEAGRPFRVVQIQVEVGSREVPAWDQPIVDSCGEGLADLVCGRIDGVAHFLLRAIVEPGLHNGAQLGPSSQVEPGEQADGDGFLPGQTSLVCECLHSEEGGRFYRDVNRFRLFDAGDAFEAPPGYWWLTLGDIRRLLDKSGWLTNEARSALSLLLKWL